MKRSPSTGDHRSQNAPDLTASQLSDSHPVSQRRPLVRQVDRHRATVTSVSSSSSAHPGPHAGAQHSAIRSQGSHPDDADELASWVDSEIAASEGPEVLELELPESDELDAVLSGEWEAQHPASESTTTMERMTSSLARRWVQLALDFGELAGRVEAVREDLEVLELEAPQRPTRPQLAALRVLAVSDVRVADVAGRERRAYTSCVLAGWAYRSEVRGRYVLTGAGARELAADDARARRDRAEQLLLRVVK